MCRELTGRPAGRPRLSDEIRDRCVELFDAGRTATEVARELGIGRSTARSILQERVTAARIGADVERRHIVEPFRVRRIVRQICPGCGGAINLAPCVACFARGDVVTAEELREVPDAWRQQRYEPNVIPTVSVREFDAAFAE